MPKRRAIHLYNVQDNVPESFDRLKPVDFGIDNGNNENDLR